MGGKMPIRILPIILLLVSLDASAAGPHVSQAPAPTVKAPPINEGENDSATCVAKWDRYHRSQECFAKYRRINGTMKPSAYKHCKEVKIPAECSH
jgi:hypothetical protein